MEKILVIDDSPGILLSMEMVLESEGYEVITADTAVEGLRQALSQNPQLILSDFILPDMNGLKLYHQLQDDPHTKDIPVVFITGSGWAEDMLIHAQLKNIPILNKPFTIEELKEVVINRMKHQVR